jgi:hypothetical protein
MKINMTKIKIKIKICMMKYDYMEYYGLKKKMEEEKKGLI